MGNEISIRITSTNTANKGMADIRREAQQTGKAVGTDMEKGFDKAEKSSKDATRKIGDDLDKTKRKAKEAGDGLGAGLGEGAEKGGGKISGALDNALGKLPGVAAGAAAGVGAVFMAGVAGAMEAETVTAGFVGAVGATEAQAGQLGAAAGALYADNFGSSIEEVGKALSSLVKADVINMDAPVAEMQRLAGAAMTTAAIVEEDVGRVARSVSTMLRTGMAQSAEEAFDMIATASQNGLNVSEDLLDTIDEYSTQFRKLGLDGPAAFGLLQQAVKGGARDTDTAADALKEFSIIAVSGTKQSAAAFEALGLDAEKMSSALAKGGPEAAAALGLVLDKTRQLEDPLTKSQIAVGLFGTKAEDLGAALDHMDTSKAVDEFGKFKGALDDANAAIEKTNADKMADAWRSFTAGLADATGATIDLLGPTEHGNDVMAKAEKIIAEETARRKESTGAVNEQAAALDKTTGSMESQAAAIDDLIRKNNEFYNGKLDVRGAEIAFNAAIDDATASLKEHGAVLDINTEAGRSNRAALDDIAGSTHKLTNEMLDNNASTDQLNAVMVDARSNFISVARAMGMGAVEAENLATELGLAARDYRATVSVDTREAENRLRSFTWLADQAARNRTAHISFSSSGMPLNVPGSAGRFEHGGVAGSHAAEGGPRGGRVLVGERGPEVVDMAPGSTVTPAGATRAILEGGGQDVRVVLEIVSSGSRADDLLLEWLRDSIRVKGGNVQTVLGS